MSINTVKIDPSTSIDVTFAIASYNSIRYLKDAVRSALDQKGLCVEVIIVDDGSNDGSLELARNLSETDHRVRVLRTKKNGGPAAARNLALKEMRGNWYAVIDSDDLITPDRSQKLIQTANLCKADIVSDNLEVFGDGISNFAMFRRIPPHSQVEITLNQYFKKSRLFSKTPSYGFLKPMIRKEVIEREKLRYNEDLRIGEDDELIVRLLAKGYRYFLTGHTMYQYRKHSTSISHRLSLENAEKMLRVEAHIQEKIGSKLSSSKAYTSRLRSIQRGVHFVRSVEHLKSGKVIKASRTIASMPTSLLLYKMPLSAFFKRLVSLG